MRGVGQAEVFMRLTQASTNYVSLGRRGFDALTGLIDSVRRWRSIIPTPTPRSAWSSDFWRELAA